MPEFYEKISDPIDFEVVEKNLLNGVYATPNSFDADVRRVFASFHQLYTDADSLEFGSLQQLQTLYTQVKRESIDQLREVVGFVCDKNFTDENDNSETPMDVSNAEDLYLPSVPSESETIELSREDFVLFNAGVIVDEKQLWIEAASDQTEEDKVRCVCGIHEEDGEKNQNFL